MYFLKHVFVTLKDFSPSLTLADIQYPLLLSPDFYHIIPSHAELQKELRWDRFNYGMFSATNHSCSQRLPLPASLPRSSLKQHSICGTLPGQCQSGVERSAQKCWRCDREALGKQVFPNIPPGVCVEAYQPTQGKTNEIKGHLLKPGHKSHGTMPHCQAAPSEHFPADNAGMCVAWRSPSSNREDNTGVPSIGQAPSCIVCPN